MGDRTRGRVPVMQRESTALFIDAAAITTNAIAVAVGATNAITVFALLAVAVSVVWVGLLLRPSEDGRGG